MNEHFVCLGLGKKKNYDRRRGLINLHEMVGWLITWEVKYRNVEPKEGNGTDNQCSVTRLLLFSVLHAPNSKQAIGNSCTTAKWNGFECSSCVNVGTVVFGSTFSTFNPEHWTFAFVCSIPSSHPTISFCLKKRYKNKTTTGSGCI